MNLGVLAEVVQAVAVVIAFGFAWAEIRRFRAQKERESTLELVHSYQTPEFAEALLQMVYLPDGLSMDELEQRLGAKIRLVAILMTTWESLGLLVFRREVDIKLVEDFFSGPIIISWQKLQPLVAEMRQKDQRDTYFEWFQWLAEQLNSAEFEADTTPAHIKHKLWGPNG